MPQAEAFIQISAFHMALLAHQTAHHGAVCHMLHCFSANQANELSHCFLLLPVPPFPAELPGQ